MSVIRWEDPPAAAPGRSGDHRKVIAHELIAIQLRARPGKWAVIVEGYPHASVASLITRGKVRAYAPAGTYEAVARTVGGAQHIYARYIGADLPSRATGSNPGGEVHG